MILAHSKVHLVFHSLPTNCLTYAPHFTDDDRKVSALVPGVGYTLWSRLASAAGTLGVDVSKAWSANISVHSGEGMFVTGNEDINVSSVQTI
jgi:hypothetical protein